ncbi:unnamed protein product, partial [Laminaria digitata]
FDRRRQGGGWGVALPRAALGWFIRRPGAAPGSAASALVNALRDPPKPRRMSSLSFGRQRQRQQQQQPQ